MNDFPSILIDKGTHTLKSGVSGDSVPRTIIPSIVGFLKPVYFNERTEYFGEEALTTKGISKIKSIISNGNVTDFYRFDELLSYNFFKILYLAPEEHPLVFSETTGVEAKEREKTTEIVFESFIVPGFYIENDNRSALNASGRVTGTVLNIGEDHSSCTPIFDNQVLSHAATFGSIGGSKINEYLQHLSKVHNNNIVQEDPKTPHIHNEIYRKMKETMCYVSLDYYKEIDKIDSKYYKLPDGKTLSLDKKSILAPEVLFQPKLFDLKDESIDKIIYSTVMKSDSFLEKDLVENIVLNGGSTAFQGIEERLKSYLNFEFSSEVKITLPSQPKYSTWIGLSILSSLSTFRDKWMTKDEYNEFGSMLIETKCPSTFSILQNNYLIFKPDYKKVLNHSNKSGDIFINFT